MNGTSRRVFIYGVSSALALGGITSCSRSKGSSIEWSKSTMEPLSMPVPSGGAVTVQDSGQNIFYWDRIWSTVPNEPAKSTIVAARLLGEGATNNIEVSQCISSIQQMTGVHFKLGEVKNIGNGSWQQILSSDSIQGALWSITNGVSKAVLILTGPGIDSSAVASAQKMISIAKEDPSESPLTGWQRRQANGVYVHVGATWNDVGAPEQNDGSNKLGWERAWVSRGTEEPPASIMVGDDLSGKSLEEASLLLQDSSGITEVREETVRAFSNQHVSGHRIDFKWGLDVANIGAAWLFRNNDVVKTIAYLNWSQESSISQESRSIVEKSVRPVSVS